MKRMWMIKRLIQKNITESKIHRTNNLFLKGSKGQSALEFLMTYGWAILIILVMISALVYFGVFNPGRLTPERCTATPGFGCQDYKVINTGVAGTSGLNAIMQNARGDSVTVKNLAPSAWAFNISGGYGCTCTVPAEAASWAADGLQTVTCLGCPPAQLGAIGDKQKGLLTAYYIPKGGSFVKSFSVDVNTAVVAS